MFFFFSSRRRHTRFKCDWSSDVCSSDLPEKVRRRILSLPAWYEVRKAPENQTTAFPITLHRGEREAILLAETLRPDVILIDEQIGRSIALSRNLPRSEEHTSELQSH